MNFGESLMCKPLDDSCLVYAPHLHCYAIQMWARILSYLSQRKTKDTNYVVSFVFGAGRGIRTPVPLGKRFSRPPRYDRFDIPAYMMQLLHHICRTLRRGSQHVANPLRMLDISHLGARSQGACRSTRRSLAIPTDALLLFLKQM